LAYVYDKYSVINWNGSIEGYNKFVLGIEYNQINGNSKIFINATIIKSGYASPMTIPPNVKHADLFKELYEEAREQKRGLWKEEKPLKPVACTAEAKICPDGSAVGRVGPNCEFKSCPE